MALAAWVAGTLVGTVPIRTSSDVAWAIPLALIELP